MDNDTIWVNDNVGFGSDGNTNRFTLFNNRKELYRISKNMWYGLYELPADWQTKLSQKYRTITYSNYLPTIPPTAK